MPVTKPIYVDAAITKPRLKVNGHSLFTLTFGMERALQEMRGEIVIEHGREALENNAIVGEVTIEGNEVRGIDVFDPPYDDLFAHVYEDRQSRLYEYE